MGKKITFIALIVSAALLIIFTTGKIHDFRKFTGNILAAIGFQNAASSQSAASSTSGDPVAISAPTLSDLLRQFQDQIQYLNEQMADVRSQIEISNLNKIFTRTLKRGDTGEDVSKLQELLMEFPELYTQNADSSSTMTGFYGSLTKDAIIQFQSQNGLPENGFFDPATREKFYESIQSLEKDNSSTKFTPIDISSVDELKNKTLDGMANLQNQISQLYSDSTSTQASVADLQNQVSQLSSDLNNAKASIADLQNQSQPQQIYPTAISSPTPTPSSSSVPFSSPALPAASQLTISNIQTTKITQNSATITWTTNSSSTGEVDYSTDISLPASKIIIVSSSTAVINHAIGLQNLSSGTSYHYRVLSKNSNNTMASSTIQNFNTLH